MTTPQARRKDRNYPVTHRVTTTSSFPKPVTAKSWSYLRGRRRDVVVSIKTHDGWATMIVRVPR